MKSKSPSPQDTVAALTPIFFLEMFTLCVQGSLALQA